MRPGGKASADDLTHQVDDGKQSTESPDSVRPLRVTHIVFDLRYGGMERLVVAIQSAAYNTSYGQRRSLEVFRRVLAALTYN